MPMCTNKREKWIIVSDRGSIGRTDSLSTSLSKKGVFIAVDMPVSLPGSIFFCKMAWTVASVLRLQCATLVDVEKLLRGHFGRIRDAVFCFHRKRC